MMISPNEHPLPSAEDIDQPYITRPPCTSMTRVGQSCRSRLHHVDGVDSPSSIPEASGHILLAEKKSRAHVVYGLNDHWCIFE